MSIAAAAGREHVRFLGRYARQAAGLMKSTLRELSVALVGDRKMSQLHEQFLGLKGPTDVLSFALDADRQGRTLSGEVVVCVGEARRAARRRKIAVGRELLLYVIHGMLHLSGYDDRTDAQYRTMHEEEDRIMRKLGIGATFAAAETAGRRRRRGGG